MRRLMLLSLMLVLASASGFAGNRIIDIRKEKGGPHGYNEVDEYHDESFSSLNCADPGYSACKFVNEPGAKLVGYAEGQIAGGVYSGSHAEVFGTLKCTVTWVANGSGYAHIVETQEDMTAVN